MSGRRDRVPRAQAEQPIDRVDFLVIGAGPTGLGAAAHLEQREADYLVVDAADRVGGAAAAQVDRHRFSWSVAGVTGAQWNTIAERLVDPRRLQLDTRIVHVDIARRTAILADGRAIDYRWCISSAPLPTALSWAGARDLGVGLRARRALVVGLGFRGDVPAGLASALDASDAPWTRLAEISELAPEQHWSIIAELPLPGYEDADADASIAAVLAGLRGFDAAPSRPVTTWAREFSPAHPEPMEDRDERLREIDALLRSHGFFSRGLFGGWRPEVADLEGAYQQGGEAVEAILEGASEDAY
ncbi:MAG TPA: NAD(P)-binding protein [Gryllotalpicola sp.]